MVFKQTYKGNTSLILEHRLGNPEVSGSNPRPVSSNSSKSNYHNSNKNIQK